MVSCALLSWESYECKDTLSRKKAPTKSDEPWRCSTDTKMEMRHIHLTETPAPRQVNAPQYRLLLKHRKRNGPPAPLGRKPFVLQSLGYVALNQGCHFATTPSRTRIGRDRLDWFS